MKARGVICQKNKKEKKKRAFKKYFSIFATRDCKNIFIITLIIKLILKRKNYG